MKKRLLILTLALLFAGAAQAQIYIMEGETNQRADGDIPVGVWPENPDVNGSGQDYYLPIGEGSFILALLGGAYLIKKKKKN